MALRDALDGAFVHHAFVERAQRVVAVFQGDFELARTEFRNGRRQRQALRLTAGVEVVEKSRAGFDFLDTVNMRVVTAQGGGARRALARGLGIEQIELQFDRHHHRVAVGLEFFNDARSGEAWVGLGRRCAEYRIKHQQHLRGGCRQPWRTHQRARQRPGQAVHVADLPQQPSLFGIVAVGGQGGDGTGQRQAFGVDTFEFVTSHRFTAQHAVEIGQHQLDMAQIGMTGEKFAGVIRMGAGAHRNDPRCGNASVMAGHHRP